jgi:hypothetical protein
LTRACSAQKAPTASATIAAAFAERLLFCAEAKQAVMLYHEVPMNFPFNRHGRPERSWNLRLPMDLSGDK